jgi:hypothetical protein
MRVKYIGSAGVRIIEPYEWNAGNGFVQEVPDEVAASLLTYPRPDFALADDEDKQAAEAAIEEVVADKKTSEK